MANHASAVKRDRQNDKRRILNRIHRGKLRTAVKNFRAALASGNAEALPGLLAAAIKQVAQTASHGVIHKNQASRTISRLQVAFNKQSAQG